MSSEDKAWSYQSWQTWLGKGMNFKCNGHRSDRQFWVLKSHVKDKVIKDG